MQLSLGSILYVFYLNSHYVPLLILFFHIQKEFTELIHLLIQFSEVPNSLSVSQFKILQWCFSFYHRLFNSQNCFSSCLCHLVPCVQDIFYLLRTILLGFVVVVIYKMQRYLHIRKEQISKMKKIKNTVSTAHFKDNQCMTMGS